MKYELFNELFCCYYTAVYHILKEASGRELENSEFNKLIIRTADTYGFPGTSNRIISTAIKLGEKEKISEDEKSDKYAWPFFEKSRKMIQGKQLTVHKSKLDRITGIPLSDIEKMWLKSIYADPRIRLFISDVTEPAELKDIEPLFDWDDFVLFDQYTDGDPFTDEQYIENFRKVLKAVHNGSRLKIVIRRKKKSLSLEPEDDATPLTKKDKATQYIDPLYIEYSERDNRFRLIGNNPIFGRNTVNLSQVISCEEVERRDDYKSEDAQETSMDDTLKEIVVELEDKNNALERFLLNVSHFNKSASFDKDKKRYIIRIAYDKADEIDLVIRIMSFGPNVKVLEPEPFIAQIRERLEKQRELFK